MTHADSSHQNRKVCIRIDTHADMRSFHGLNELTYKAFCDLVVAIQTKGPGQLGIEPSSTFSNILPGYMYYIQYKPLRIGQTEFNVSIMGSEMTISLCRKPYFLWDGNDDWRPSGGGRRKRSKKHHAVPMFDSMTITFHQVASESRKAVERKSVPSQQQSAFPNDCLTLKNGNKLYVSAVLASAVVACADSRTSYDGVASDPIDVGLCLDGVEEPLDISSGQQTAGSEVRGIKDSYKFLVAELQCHARHQQQPATYTSAAGYGDYFPNGAGTDQRFMDAYPIFATAAAMEGWSPSAAMGRCLE